MDDRHETNRKSWNAATARHLAHRKDQANFFHNGGTTLSPDEIRLLGDINGQKILHLQCNAGQDSVSLALRLGAQVTGVDISDTAIDAARQLADQTGANARFIRADIFDWFTTNTQHFDMVFSSYGTTCWLSDLTRWGQGIADALKPGGRFVFIDFHPAGMMFEDGYVLTYDYMGGKQHNLDGVGDYVGEQSGTTSNTGDELQQTAEGWRNPHPSHEFSWGLADHLQALLKAGLTIMDVEEYPYSYGYQPFGDLIEQDHRRFTRPPGQPTLPLMFSITARR
jgi:SAM-dependent methyltransferase